MALNYFFFHFLVRKHNISRKEDWKRKSTLYQGCSAYGTESTKKGASWLKNEIMSYHAAWGFFEEAGMRTEEQ